MIKKCLLILIILVCMQSILGCESKSEESVEECNHKWIEATCIYPKICEKCGIASGELIEHKWVDANCDTPAICTECGESAGKALGHVWIDANCISPKTCAVCEKTEGEALGHKWNEATYTEAKTCEICRVTEGEKLESPEDEVVGTYQYVENFENEIYEIVININKDGTAILSDSYDYDVEIAYGTWFMVENKLYLIVKFEGDDESFEMVFDILPEGIKSDDVVFLKK